MNYYGVHKYIYLFCLPYCMTVVIVNRRVVKRNNSYYLSIPKSFVDSGLLRAGVKYDAVMEVSGNEASNGRTRSEGD